MKQNTAVNSAKQAELLDSATRNLEAIAPVKANGIQPTKEQLPDDQMKRLAGCEAVISKGIKTFLEVGSALLEIRDNRLYRDQFDTFENYCRTKWKFSARQAYHLMDASAVVKTLECEQLFTKKPMAIPTTESAARALAKLAPEQQVEVARAVGEKTSAPTAKDFKEAVAEVAGKKPKAETNSYVATTFDKDHLAKLVQLLDQAQTQAKKISDCADVAKTLGELTKQVTRKLNGGGH